MDVKMLEKQELKLPSGAVQVHDEGWTGAVPDAIGQKWVDDGVADDVTATAADDAGFTQEQTAALKAAADQILAAQGDNGEPIDLNDLTVPELRGIADDVGLGTAAEIKKMKKPELVEKISAAIAEAQAANAGAE